MTAYPATNPRRSVLRAVIERARDHARRRRARNAVIFLAIALAAFVGRTVLHGEHGSGRVAGKTAGPIETGRGLAKNGSLALQAVQPNVRDEAPAGWYDISSVDEHGRLRPLVRCPGHVSWCGEIESIDWSPDGESLAFGVTSFAQWNPYNGLHVFDFRTRRDRLIVRAGDFGERDWLEVDWAPGGRELAYAAQGHIAVINSDGTRRTLLRTGPVRPDRSPSWSPNGRWLAFSSRHDWDRHSSVYVIRRDGSGLRTIAGNGVAPAWSPDGTRIAFLAHDRIQLVSPNGRLLAGDLGITGVPVWSPDGTKIAMSNRRVGTWVMNADGSGLKQLTRYAQAVSIGYRPRPTWRPRYESGAR